VSRPSAFDKSNKPVPARAFLDNTNVNDDTNVTKSTSENVDIATEVSKNAITNADARTNVTVNTNVNVYKKKERFEDTHTRQTYYIENDLIKQLHEFAGFEKGVKTKVVNDAIREHLKKIKNKPLKWDIPK
jgi:hypothetical protein